MTQAHRIAALEWGCGLTVAIVLASIVIGVTVDPEPVNHRGAESQRCVRDQAAGDRLGQTGRHTGTCQVGSVQNPTAP